MYNKGARREHPVVRRESSTPLDKSQYGVFISLIRSNKRIVLCGANGDLIAAFQSLRVVPSGATDSAIVATSSQH